MTKNTQSQALLRSFFGTTKECSVVEGENAIELQIRRGGVIISITLPIDVQEWFVGVEDSDTGAKAHDWYDYSGYDSRPEEELDRDMAQDLRAFVEDVLRSELRMRIVDSKRARAILEREVDGTWKGLVPADVWT